MKRGPKCDILLSIIGDQVMIGYDKNGKPYAKLSDLKEGDVVIPDGGFDCMAKGDHRKIIADGDRLYVNCGKGQHFLDGQDDGDGYLVGLYRS